MVFVCMLMLFWKFYFVMVSFCVMFVFELFLV